MRPIRHLPVAPEAPAFGFAPLDGVGSELPSGGDLDGDERGEDGESLLQVGDLARASGKTVRAIHHYEEVGLLRPHARSKGRYRLYDQSAIARVRWIGKLHDLGLSLSQIQEMVQLWETAPSAPGAMGRIRGIYAQKLARDARPDRAPRHAGARARGEHRRTSTRAAPATLRSWCARAPAATTTTRASPSRTSWPGSTAASAPTRARAALRTERRRWRSSSRFTWTTTRRPPSIRACSTPCCPTSTRSSATPRAAATPSAGPPRRPSTWRGEKVADLSAHRRT